MSQLTREIINRKIFEKIVKKNKNNLKEQAIRGAISYIHRKQTGITVNAAAYLFAKKHNVSVWRYLKDRDIQSLKSTLQTVNASQTRNGFSQHDIKKSKYLPESEFSSEASKNANVYPYVYILENSLRKLILEKFDKQDNWWADKVLVSNDIRSYAEKVKGAESKYPWMPKRAKHPIYYIGLEQLFKIIIRNWGKYFKNVFSDLGDLRTWGRESVPIRHLIAHNIATRKLDKDNIKIKTDYVLNCIKNSRKN